MGPHQSGVVGRHGCQFRRCCYFLPTRPAGPVVTSAISENIVKPQAEVARMQDLAQMHKVRRNLMA